MAIKSKSLRLFLYLLGIFVFQELVFRICFPIPELSNFDRINYMVWDRDKVNRYKHQRNQNWYWESQADTDAVFEHEMNLYGFRDQEWTVENTSGKQRVFFIGDSFVEGLMASGDETITQGFDQASEQEYETFNMGMMGTGLEAYFQLLTDAMPIFKPQYVFMVISSNDLGQKRPWLPEMFMTPEYFNNSRPRLLELIDQLKLDSPIRFRWINSSKPYIPKIEAENHPWHGKEDTLLRHVTPQMATFMKDGTYSPFRVNNLYNEEKQLKQVPVLGDAIPFLVYFCKKYNTKPIVVYVPSKNLTTKYYYPYEKEHCMVLCNDSFDLTTPEYQIHQAVLAQSCRKNGVPFINLTPVVRNEEAKNNHLYWNYDDHMRGKGYLLLGKSIYQQWKQMN